MKRRTVLATLGTATVATAGCLSDAGDRQTETDEPSPDGTETDEPGTDGSNGTPTPGDGTGTPLGDPFSDMTCPSFTENTDRTGCWPTADAADNPIYMDASTAVFEPSTGDDSVEFVLHNESDESFGLNPHAWAIKRRTENGWEHVAPEEWVEPWYTVESGQTYTWRLSMTERTQAMAERTMAVTEDLDDGTYAFQITGIADEGSEDSRRVEIVAVFEVQRRE